MTTHDTTPRASAAIALRDRLFLALLRIAATIRFRKVLGHYTKLDGQTGLPNPVVPKTANDKFLWRKIFDRNPLFPVVADKIAVRDWLAEHGYDIATPTIRWIGTDLDTLPDALWRPGHVLKASHGSGWNVFLRDPMPDRPDTAQRVRGWLSSDYGGYYGERFYRRITPRLLLEELVSDATMEMKFYTFGSHVARVYVRYDRLSEPDEIADIWRIGEDGRPYVSTDRMSTAKRRAERPVPPAAEPALDWARRLGAHFDHVRVDFLSNGTDIWLSELTLTNLGGHFEGVEDDVVEAMNRTWDLSGTWFMTYPHKGWRRRYADALRRTLSVRSA